MSASEIIRRARHDLNDTQKAAYSDQKLLLYINDGIARINNMLLAQQSNYITDTVTFVSSPAKLPSDFLAMYRNYPDDVRVEGDWVYFRPSEPITLRYYKKLKPVVEVTDEIPLGTEFYPLLTLYVVMLAGNSNEYNPAFELQLINTLEVELTKLIRLRDGVPNCYSRAQKYYL